MPSKPPLDSTPMSPWARLVASSVLTSACLATSIAHAAEAAAPRKSASDSPLAPPADAPKPKAGDGESSPKAEDFGHSLRFGLRVGVVGGLRMVFRYSDETAFCKDPDKDPEERQKFCGHQAPFALESALSFGVGDSLEPFIWGRLGLSGEPETNTEPLVLLGIGTRIYTMNESRFKVFFEPAVAWELEGGGKNPNYQQFTYEKDLALHLGGGFQVELHQNVGIFLGAGLTTAVIRSLSSNLEVQVGIQGRTPALL